MIRILANPRSGTMSTAKSLQNLGLDVRHEAVGKDGTVSCFFFIDSSYYPEGKNKGKKIFPHRGDGVPSDYDWKISIHLVRNPIDCIPSMCSIVSKNHKKWLLEMGIIELAHAKKKILACMSAYYEQNEIFEKICGHRIKLEDNGKELMRILRLKGSYPVLHVNKTPPAWKVECSWEILYNSDYYLAEKIRKQAIKYGYEAPKNKRVGIRDLMR